VPDAAVSVLAGVPSVYVIDNGTIAQTSVTLGVRQGDNWEITSGLKGDEILATNRLNELASGVAVRMLKPGETDGGPAAGAGQGGALGAGRGDASQGGARAGQGRRGGGGQGGRARGGAGRQGGGAQ
jgi:hypothetical protein